MKNHLYTFGLLLAVVGNAQAATVAPKITKISVTPTSAPAGTMFKFTAELNAPLTTGNKVKIDLGKGLASMTGTKTSYSLSRAIYTTGSQTYKVGIYNAKNVLQGKVSNGNYSVSSSTNNAPILTLVSGDDSAIQNKIYTLQFKATDSDKNLHSITIDWKDGSKEETQMATNDATFIHFFTHTYVTAGTFELTVIAKDSGTPVLTSKQLLKTIEVTPRYSKVCNSGELEGEEDCPVNPILGNKETDWGCTKDNKTDLIWEVKTSDGGLRDNKSTYSWYSPDFDKYRGYTGYQDGGICTDSICNTFSYTNTVNKYSLCGANDWRMPTIDELQTLIYCSDGKYSNEEYNIGYCINGEDSKKPVNNPTIDITYFPDTTNDSNPFWTNTPEVPYGSNFRWYVLFGYGSYMNTNDYGLVAGARLVRGTYDLKGQSILMFDASTLFYK